METLVEPGGIILGERDFQGVGADRFDVADLLVARKECGVWKRALKGSAHNALVRLQQLLDVARSNQPPAIDHKYRVAKLLDLGHQVAGDKNGEALMPDFLAQERENLVRALGVHAVGRL